ncbi:MAG: IS481 family transposase [Actinobacteria bacterium]|nr:IS481 family transposase [Actinomycetota bacterium]
MDKGRFLIETHLRTGRPIAELAAAHGVSRSWLYKLLARYRVEGDAGLETRSRRPHHSPARIAGDWEDDIVALRKELIDLGVDAGAVTIQSHLERRRATAPSTSTIWRVLKARGFVVPQPHKRPRSSYVRFCAELPNECWQADVTHVARADGGFFEVLNIIDDHSRLCVASRAFVTTRSPDVVRTMHRAAANWGYPERFLTDNGAIFTASARGGMAAMESELLSLGIAARHSRPYHPQTCGKVERFHQTLKKFLAKQDPVLTKKQLQHQLDRFVAYYNDIRPHRGVGRRTPAQAFSARERAYPTGPRIDTLGYRVRHDRVSKGGNVTLRYRGRLHHIGVGASYMGWRVILLVAGLEVRILSLDGSQLRRLTLDPTIDYQPMP